MKQKFDKVRRCSQLKVETFYRAIIYLKRGIKTVDFDSYSKARRCVKGYSQYAYNVQACANILEED